MADFRKLFYALAMVALVVGLSIPASAQGGAVTCSAFTTPTLARAEGYAELVGDFILQCQGGTPTPPGQIVPSVNVQVFLSTNVTSKLTGTATATAAIFDEALLLIDEPNAVTSTAAASRPVLNCGNGANSPDTGVSGPGVCQIIAPSPNAAVAPGMSNPAATYDGTPGVVGTQINAAAPFGVACGTTFPPTPPATAPTPIVPGSNPPQTVPAAVAMAAAVRTSSRVVSPPHRIPVRTAAWCSPAFRSILRALRPLARFASPTFVRMLNSWASVPHSPSSRS